MYSMIFHTKPYDTLLPAHVWLLQKTLQPPHLAKSGEMRPDSSDRPTDGKAAGSFKGLRKAAEAQRRFIV